jgi:hypothetical protein
MRKFHLSVLVCLLLCAWTHAQVPTPPATWQEHWFEHNQLLTRMYYDNDVAVYYDNDVSRSITWPYQYMGDVWRYAKKTYGYFGVDPRLYAIFHTGKYSGGHPSGYFDASHDNRNVADVGPGPWTSGNNGDLNLVTHEVGHVIEGDSKNHHNSPAFNIWGDSKWCEIFIYDVYQGLGRTADATTVFNNFTNTVDNFPRANTHWFRDWFYPIYSTYGGNKALNRFFVLLSLYFPKNGNDYARDMNWGEFVHFWSAAAGANLKTLATNAFGWSTTTDAQFTQAQADFPLSYSPVTIGVSMYQDLNYTGYGISLPVGDYTLTQLRAYGAINDDLTSIKVTPGYKVTLYADDNFSGASTVITSDVSLLDGTWNDKVSSVKVSTNTAATVAVVEPEAKEEKPLLVYPNPVAKGSDITVQVPKYDATSPVLVSLLDINNHVVSYQKENAGTVRVSTAKAASGMHILVIKNGVNNYTQKVLIQ